jgi:hypothetical protein
MRRPLLAAFFLLVSVLWDDDRAALRHRLEVAAGGPDEVRVGRIRDRTRRHEAPRGRR